MTEVDVCRHPSELTEVDETSVEASPADSLRGPVQAKPTRWFEVETARQSRKETTVGSGLWREVGRGHWMVLLGQTVSLSNTARDFPSGVPFQTKRRKAG